MNRNLLKNIALNVRKQLIEGISYKAKKQGVKVAVEEVAYFFFVRLIAIRFMEVNKFIDCSFKNKTFNKSEFISICNYLSEAMPNIFQKLDDSIIILLPENMFGERSIIMDLVDGIEECYWSADIEEEMHLKSSIKENKLIDDAQNGIEIIGWLHQYYFSIDKDKIFCELKKEKLNKTNIPTVTQIFTPKWIVRYMVENSLGRLWLESHYNKYLLNKWKYLIKNEEEEFEGKTSDQLLTKEELNPEKIKILDPAMGSGHILTYAFDILYDIYLSYGYEKEKIPLLIIEKNIYGLDIDDSVSKLASFAILMKARSKNPNILEHKPKLNLISIQESNEISKEIVEYLTHIKKSSLEYSYFKKYIEYLVGIFQDAKEYGALLDINEINFDRLEKTLKEIKKEIRSTFATSANKLYEMEATFEKLYCLINQGRIMSQKYDVVVANPPYSGLRKLNGTLKKFIVEEYGPYKYDLFSVFMVKNMKFTKPNGIASFMTPNVWQFISSYEALRSYIINNYQILSLVQLDEDGFKDASVSISTFTIKKCTNINKAVFIKLCREGSSQRKRIEEIFSKENENKFYVNQSMFKRIPGSKIAFWVSEKTIKSFEKGKQLEEFGKPRQGMATSDNNRFLKYWYEVNIEDICFFNKNFSTGNYKWVPYNKGGGNKKWYGNNTTVINWENNGEEVKEYAKNLYGNYTRTIKNENFYFKEGITYTFIGESIAPRFSPKGFIFDVAGSMIFIKKNKLYYILGLLGSKISKHYMNFLNPTLNIQVGDIKSIPVIETADNDLLKQIDDLVLENIEISKNDWDSFEISWDFKIHPILKYKHRCATIKQAYESWQNFAEHQFNKLKENEEKLNRIFIDIYGLKKELAPEEDDKCVTIRKANEEREIKSLISYAVGCMFGRYSLNKEGLIYAGGKFGQKFKFINKECYINVGEGWEKSIIDVVTDNMIFTSDNIDLYNNITNRFFNFVELAFGAKNLEENLDYIAGILDKKSKDSSRQIIKRYFIKDFFMYHLQIYKKKPIYRLINNKIGYKSLIYIHRQGELNIDKISLDK